MIRISDSNIGVAITFEGNIKEIARKINYNEIVSIRGRRFSESSRGVTDLDAKIEFLSEDDYGKLQDIFLLSNKKLEIEDLDTGKIYMDYYISSNSLSLDRYEDFIEKIYYYKGGLTLFKR